MNTLYYGDNPPILREHIRSESVDLMYRVQTSKAIAMNQSHRTAKPVKAWRLLLLLILSGCLSPSRPPADEILVENLSSQRHEFETLVSMFLEDEDLEKVATWWIRPQNATVSRQRLQEYRQLLNELDLYSVERIREGVFLTAYAGGALPDDGVYKGYAYFPKGIPRELGSSVIESLDELEWDPYYVTEYYRKIDEKWYLRFFA